MGSIERRVQELGRKSDQARAAAELRANPLPYILHENGDGIPRDLHGNPADLSRYPADGPRVMIIRVMTEEQVAAKQRETVERRVAGSGEPYGEVGVR